MSVVMGFDFGIARIGVAVGGFGSRQAEAVTTLRAKNGQPDWDKIAALIATWQPATLVVGTPFIGNAAKSPAASRLEKQLSGFRRTLQARFDLPVELADETYTSTEARHLLKEQRRAGRTAKVRKDEVDMTAAAVMLQSWLAQAQPPGRKRAS